MIRYGKTTKLSPAQVLAKGAGYFGPGGLGLDTQEQGAGCARWTGGGGFVYISTCAGTEGTEINLEAREWEEQAREFVSRL